MAKTNWQRQDITQHYLEQIRGAIPFGADQVKMMLNLIQHFCPDPKSIIDLGCGNGFLAEVILKAYPNSTALLIDHSKPMIEAAKKQMNSFGDRCNVIEADLSQSILNHASPDSIDCIVSGFAIHHLPHKRKKELYYEIYELLTPRGIFINIEHVKSASVKVEKLYDQLFIDHLSAYNNRNREEVAKDYKQRPDKEDNILERVEVQMNWLSEIGFHHVDCYLKWMELAVFAGVKEHE